MAIDHRREPTADVDETHLVVAGRALGAGDRHRPVGQPAPPGRLGRDRRRRSPQHQIVAHPKSLSVGIATEHPSRPATWAPARLPKSAAVAGSSPRRSLQPKAAANASPAPSPLTTSTGWRLHPGWRAVGRVDGDSVGAVLLCDGGRPQREQPADRWRDRGGDLLVGAEYDIGHPRRDSHACRVVAGSLHRRVASRGREWWCWPCRPAPRARRASPAATARARIRCR